MKKFLLACLVIASVGSFALDKRTVSYGVAGIAPAQSTITIPAVVGQKFYVTAMILRGDATTSNFVISDGTTIVTHNIGSATQTLIAGGEPVYVGQKGVAITAKINGNANFSAIVTGVYDKP